MRYLKLVKRYFLNQLSSFAVFLEDTILLMISDLFGLVFSIVFFKAIFSYVEAIGSWNYPSVLLLVGSANLVDSLYRFFFERGVQSIPRLVRRGTLDYALLKPIDPQFYLSFGKFNFETISSIFVSFYIVAISAKSLGLGGWNWFFYFLLLIISVCLRYSFALYSSVLSFYITDVTAFYALQSEFFRYSQYPYDVFKRVFEKVFFTFLIPIVVVANVPSLTLLKAKEFIIFVGPLVALLHVILARVLFLKSLNKYQSAGG